MRTCSRPAWISSLILAAVSVPALAQSGPDNLPHIIGGVDAEPGQYPFMASLQRLGAAIRTTPGMAAAPP